jgi:hypothetical protein
MAEAMPEMVDAFGSMQIFARARFQRWDELLAAPAPPEKMVINSVIDAPVPQGRRHLIRKSVEEPATKSPA